MIPVKINVDEGVIMQKINFYTGMAATCVAFIPQNILAAECAVTDCSLLGYTDSPCPGSGLKCPFGEGWYCGGGAAEDCIKLGYDKACTGAGESGSGETCNGKYQSCTCDSTYKYTCSGTGYSGGSGSACGGKYTKCSCQSPYTWTSGACKCPSTYKYTCSGTGYSGGSGTACGGKYTQCKCSANYEWSNGTCKSSCAVGTLYYSDGNCSTKKESGKTLLGIVVFEKTSSKNGWIMTIKPAATGIAWDTDSYSTTGVTSTSADNSCYNTQSLLNKGSNFAAANAANSYSAGGKKWCLPSYEVLNNITKSDNFTKINTGITTAGGKILGSVAGVYEAIWSSTEYNEVYAWNLYIQNNNITMTGATNHKTNTYNYMSVRPVTSF